METKEQLPNATLILVFGILSIVSCFCYGIFGLIFGIIALVLSKNATTLYNANPEMYTGYENVKAGKICAIIGVVLSALLFLLMIIYFIFIGAMLPWSEIMEGGY
ncbi:CCC motif membrane protein [Aquimarina sp. MMG016]|uniref:CCC motif membrane protein n=1 Tax=Aquimarina sp. MMG016 TaxID=2822690 RepID=UPI001B3A5E54|nr:CCC motif membrane protein [Aquimarina sp. MMG016]MBQ4821242.1 DUF4190 domain-containing protein [Aquimarina sp. MMG016]